MSKYKKSGESKRNSTEVHVTNENLLGLRFSEILNKFYAGKREGEAPFSVPTTSGLHQLKLEPTRGGAVGGLRTYIPEEIGTGCWDFINLSDGFFLSITDATYFKAHKLDLPAEQIFKIRMLCSGTLIFPHDDVRLSEGSCTIQLFHGHRPSSFVIQPNSPLRMVVLHAYPESLATLGATDNMLPEQVRPNKEPAGKAIDHFSVPSSAKLIRIAQDMIESRDHVPNELRPTYIKAKAQELFCETIIRARSSVEMLVSGNRIRQSDVPRFHEAKRILSSNLESSPTIEQLSRLVGINRTKLKAGFRELFGETIQTYRNRVRLTEARVLIEETELPLAEIGRMIGFRHAANFTQAVKRHFGVRPLELRKRHVATRFI